MLKNNLNGGTRGNRTLPTISLQGKSAAHSLAPEALNIGRILYPTRTSYFRDIWCQIRDLNSTL